MSVSGAERAALERARELALRGRGRVSPNPLVGAVVLRDGATVAEGWHEGPGLPHAEAAALAAAGEAARGATMVCTLEPCSHHGRTPPCADALVAAGVARVVIGAADPLERDRAQGREVLQGGRDRGRRRQRGRRRGVRRAQRPLPHLGAHRRCPTSP